MYVLVLSDLVGESRKVIFFFCVFRNACSCKQGTIVVLHVLVAHKGMISVTLEGLFG